MAREVGVRPIDLRLVIVGRRHAALQIVRHPDRRTAAEVLDHAHVRAHPRREVLAARGLGIDQPARPEDADKEFDLDAGPRRRVDQRRALPREIDKEFLAGPMHLAHRGLEHLRPAAIALAEVAVGVPGRVRAPILQPEQLQGDAGAFQLLVQLGPRGHRLVEAGRVGRSGKQARFQRRVVHGVDVAHGCIGSAVTGHALGGFDVEVGGVEDLRLHLVPEILDEVLQRREFGRLQDLRPRLVGCLDRSLDEFQLSN